MRGAPAMEFVARHPPSTATSEFELAIYTSASTLWVLGGRALKNSAALMQTEWHSRFCSVNRHGTGEHHEREEWGGDGSQHCGLHPVVGFSYAQVSRGL